MAGVGGRHRMVRRAKALWLLVLAIIFCAAPALAADGPGAFVTTTTEVAKGAVEDKEGASFSEAVSAEVIGDQKLTLFQLTLTKGVPAEIFSVSGPYRVIVDLPDVGFRLPSNLGQSSRGLVTAFRFGQFAERKARIVIDTSGPVKIAKATMTTARGGGGVVLAIELVPTDSATFAETEAAQQPAPQTAAAERAPVAKTPPDPSETTAAIGTLPARPDSAKPLILIDPGHGGVDPGAVGAGDAKEKDVVLAVARKLKAILQASGKYEVHMTRSSDVFVSLDERLAISRSLAANLFISLHADSIDQPELAQSVAGATVYTMSERATDAAARAKAEKENASDLIAGLKVANAEENADVMNILLDLVKRETANFSAEFSRSLVGQMRRKVSLARNPQKSAAFKVLRQVNTPSVLIELGYISNPEEAQEMTSAAFQDRVSRSVAAAIDDFFSRRRASTP